MVSGKCLTDGELRQLIQSPAADDDQGKLEAHLESCNQCRLRLDELAGSINIPSGRGSETCQFASEALTEAIAKLRAVAPDAAAEVQQDPKSGRFAFLSPSTIADNLGRLGKYEIRSVIGEGGMGVVFAATDPALHRDVAIKVPAHSLVATQEAHDRFMREARAIASVKHDNIVTVHAVEEHGENLYLVMELIDGQSLAQRIDKEHRLPWAEVARIGFETTAALVAAHARGLVHRDVKPGNILIEGGNGRVKVTDFGLAKSRVDVSLTGSGILAGTPEFMSPEQANDEPVTEQSDFFSLGAVLYAACSGESPFRGQTAVTTLKKVCQKEVQSLHELDPTIPVWFSGLIQRLMAKTPADRPVASELIQILSEHQSDIRPTHANTYAATDVAEPKTDKSRQRPVLAVVSILMLMGLLITFYDWPSDTGTGDEPLRFSVVGNTDRFATLADAVGAAEDGDAIEVHNNGPVLVESLDVETKSLTIRAAKGSAPVLMASTTNEISDKPFLTCDADIHLEGLEVRWRIQNKSRPSSLHGSGRCIIDVSGGKVSLENCRLIAGRMNGCVSVSNGSLELINCHFVATKGPCCRWVPGTNDELVASNCLFQGRVGIMFDSVASGESSPIRFDLTNNSFATFRALHMVMDRPVRPTEFRSVRNAFDSDELLTLLPVRKPPAGPLLTAPQARRLVMQNTDWTESTNGYRPGIAFLSRAIGFKRDVLVSSLTDWRFMWPDRIVGSLDVEFKELEPADLVDSNRFADVRVPLSTDQSVGADLTIVGPRTTGSKK